MRQVKIRLNTVDLVKEFVQEISNIPGDCDIVSGYYVIDAKSIMGIFSLDLSKPLMLSIHDDEADLTKLDKFTIGDYTQM